MKKVRLDQILLHLGKGSEEQIRKALLRQKSRGGKLGTHLLYYGYFSEEELVSALSDQFQIPGVALSAIDIPADVVAKLPVSVAEEHLAIPFRFDRQKGELQVAIAEPENPGTLIAIQRATGIANVVLHVAPEIVLRHKIAQHYHGREAGSTYNQAIDLPDLFAEDQGASPAPSGEGKERDASAPSGEPVLLFTRQAYLTNVLPSIFERERLRLAVATSAAEVAERLKGTHFRRVLVSEESREEFERFAAAPENAGALGEAIFFRTVGSSLLENLVPYDRMFDCLFAAVQAVAEARNPGLPTPYALIARDVADVGRALGLGRIAIDGLRIGACLLVPQAPVPENAPDPAPPPGNRFAGLDASVQIARQLAFPWDIAGCLQTLSSDPAKNAGRPPQGETAMSVPAGVLSLVWYRHHALSSLRGGSRGEVEVLKSRLRGQAGRLTPSSVVEAYIRILEQADQPAGGSQDIFIVGEGEPLPSVLLGELRSHGFRIVETDDWQEARKMYLRRRPAAVLVHVDRARPAADAFCRHLREELKDADTALIAVTRRNEPSFLLNLMDTWFSDVLPLPMSSPVVVARITRALSAREKGAGASPGNGFSATFKDLSFLDLVQTLGSGGRDARMRIENSGGLHAEVYFREGRIIHAACGEITGAPAVYRVISWQEDGSFRVEPASSFPADNVSLPTDYLLLEGLRRLDEGLAGRGK